jgi:antitoxin (DNA-binding transcriptional repressor) of toxin-antitoxin stability system
MPTISATDLARNTREILDKVVIHGETVIIERSRTIVAQIVPAVRTMTASEALAGLGLPILTPEQAAAWLKDSKDGNDSKDEFLDRVRDPWA